MSVLSDNDLNELLKEERTYLGITWQDSATDDMLKNFIRTSARRLETIYGGDLQFVLTGDEEMSKQDMLAHDLLLARVFYQREKALDDFDTNYRGELMALRNYGKIMLAQQEKDNAEKQQDV